VGASANTPVHIGRYFRPFPRRKVPAPSHSTPCPTQPQATRSRGTAFSASVFRPAPYFLPSFNGEVAEWSIAPDSKSGVGQPTVGSNPILSANFRPELRRVPHRLWWVCPTPRAVIGGRNAAEAGSEAAADLSLKLPAALGDQRVGGPPEEPSPRSRWRSDTAERVECALENPPRFHTVVAR
jgi:hypothetical protein